VTTYPSAHAQNNTALPNNTISLLNTTIATLLNNNTTTQPINTTAGTTTTTPLIPTTTTTLSPEQIFHLKCLDFDDWLPDKALWCANPFDLCFLDTIDDMNSYLTCKTHLNGTQPSKHVRDSNPMLLTSYMYKMARNIINAFEQIKTLNPTLAKMDSARKTIEVQSNIIFHTGLQYRYGDKKWPDYQDNLFKPKKKWNKRNDSITIPYGSFPRAREYQYHFFAYENLVDIAITDKEQVRLMDEWPDHHSIYNGEYVGYMAEKNLYYKENMEINTAVMQVIIKPDVDIPLPGEVIIVFNHKNYNMKNPICVYWQFIKPDDPEELPSAGYWSNFGIEYRNGNDTMTVCKAYHDGIFAVMMEKIIPVEKEFDWWALIMLIGMVIAIVISGTYIFFMFMFKMHLDIYCRLFMYTAVAVFLFQASFLYAYMKRENWNDCTSMTAFIEVWHVQIVTFVMLQSVHQLSRLRLFFNDKTNIDALYLILGWGIPIAVLVALQGFPHRHYEMLRYCWADFEGLQFLYYAGPLIVLSLTTFVTMFFITKEMQKSPEKNNKDINFIRATRSIKSGTIVLLTVGVSWVIGTYGLMTDGVMQVILMLAQPFINIILSWELWSYFFYNNDAVEDALEENRKIKEMIRFRKFKHLQGIKMKVKYEAKEGDMETNKDELMMDDGNEDEVRQYNADEFDEVDLDDLVDYDEDSPDYRR
jgi:7 transmembrane receptor (Secretin family).